MQSLNWTDGSQRNQVRISGLFFLNKPAVSVEASGTNGLTKIVEDLLDEACNFGNEGEELKEKLCD